MGSIERLIEEVRTVRRLQKDYFRTRSRETLIAARQHEAKLDKMLEECVAPNLFSE